MTDDNKEVKLYFPLYHTVINRLMQCSDEALRLFIALARYAHIGNGICYPATRTLIKDSAIDKNKVYPAICDLESKGLLRWWTKDGARAKRGQKTFELPIKGVLFDVVTPKITAESDRIKKRSKVSLRDTKGRFSKTNNPKVSILSPLTTETLLEAKPIITKAKSGNVSLNTETGFPQTTETMFPQNAETKDILERNTRKMISGNNRPIPNGTDATKSGIKSINEVINKGIQNRIQNVDKYIYELKNQTTDESKHVYKTQIEIDIAYLKKNKSVTPEWIRQKEEDLRLALQKNL